jgi:hypothetical protein
MGQNFNRSEPSLKDIVQDQLRINSEDGKKLLANDRIQESIEDEQLHSGSLEPAELQ